MRQQACMMQIPYGLKQCHCPQFRLAHRATASCEERTAPFGQYGRDWAFMRSTFPSISRWLGIHCEVMSPPRGSPRAKVHQKERRPVWIVGQHACKILRP